MAQSVVAIVDDDTSLRRALARLLRSAGLEVALYASAEEFLESRSSGALPACLVLDIHLTGMSGLDLLSRLRETGNHLPVLLITAHDDVQTREQAAKLGCAAYLRKPLNPSKLLQEISRIIERQDANDYGTAAG